MGTKNIQATTYAKTQKQNKTQVGMTHAFNRSSWEAEAGGSLSLRPAWSTEQFSGQSWLHSESLSQKIKPVTFSKSSAICKLTVSLKAHNR
ncbi:hypothetical protein ACRRTK_022242 [Alexandromys fortis]